MVRSRSKNAKTQVNQSREKLVNEFICFVYSYFFLATIEVDL
jgi:hypothetical protein